MNGFVKSSTIIAIVLLSATVAFAAGTLRPAPSGGIHPDPLHGKDNAVTHATNPTARDAIGEAIAREVSREEQDKLRILRVK